MKGCERSKDPSVGRLLVTPDSMFRMEWGEISGPMHGSRDEGGPDYLFLNACV